MQNFKKFLIQQMIQLALVYCSECKPNWHYELTNVYTENFTPDIVIIDLNKTTISRGVYAISGTIDIKQDIDTDELLIENDMYLSRTGSKGSYVKTPVYSNKLTFTEFGKKIYQPYMWDTIINCTENPWRITNGQLEPLTKRLMKFNNCAAKNDKMPSHMTPGYYRLLTRFKNKAEGTITYEFTIITD